MHPPINIVGSPRKTKELVSVHEIALCPSLLGHTRIVGYNVSLFPNNVEVLVIPAI